MKLAIVTGVSKGLGASVAELFLKSNIPLIGISRTENNELKQIAGDNNTAYEHLSVDLRQEKELENLAEALGEKLAHFQPTIVYLVNNAAMVKPVHQASNINPKELSNHINLNLTAPVILTNSLLAQASGQDAILVALTVTSGAAENPIYGWSAYCSTKAGMNMYTKTVALEQEELNTGHKIIAFNPGIMDTNMQANIREHTHEEFIDIDRFKSYKENQLLRQPREVAEVLYKIIIKEEKIQNGYIYTVDEYL